MDIKSIRKDFVIYVVDDEESIRSILFETLKDAGYNVQTYPTAVEAFEIIKKEPPHVILSDIRMPGMTGIELLEAIRTISSDIQFIIMTSHASLDTAIHAMRLGAYDYLHKPFEQVSDVVTTVDRAVERIYLQYQNEQLLEELNSKNGQLQLLNQQIQAEKNEIETMNRFMAQMNKVNDLNSVVEVFLKEVMQLFGSGPILYFKYLSSYYSLVLSKTEGVPFEKYRGIGISFGDTNSQTALDSLKKPQDLVKLKDLMRDVFRTEKYFSAPVEVEGQVVGIVVKVGTVELEIQKRLFEGFLQVFRSSYLGALMQKRFHDMAIKDALTGLFNRRYFNERVEEEISRARRTHFPVSLVYMDIDHFKKYNDQNGHPAGDVLLKMLSSVLMKTSRRNDVVARLGGEEFVILLPHTDKMGAAIKAEKIRRIVEMTKFPHGEKQPLGKITLSLGVSEYPTLANDSETLVKSADEALYQVKQTSRNKVCLASAPADFKPDFVPQAVPKASGASR